MSILIKESYVYNFPHNLGKAATKSQKGDKITMASIRKRGNSYQITVSNGRDNTGKQVLETATFKPDLSKTQKQQQKDLEAFVIDFERKVKNGKFLDGEKVTFQEFAHIWLEDYAKQHMEETTRHIYKLNLETHVIPEIGHLRLSKIQPSTLNRLYNNMLQMRTDGKKGGYSTATIKYIHAIISSIFCTAIKWNVLLDNPCTRVTPPKQTKNISDIKYFTLKQTEEFLNEIETEVQAGILNLQYKVFYHMALFCGLRKGELLALKWSDIDFNKNTVSITKSTGIAGKKVITKSPKNKSSIREISIPASVVSILKQYKKEQAEYRLSIGDKWIGEDYIFIQYSGKQMSISIPYATFKKIILNYNKKANQPLPNIPLHGLRHTSATLLISQNIDVKTVSSRLGHSQTSTTMNIYSHALKKMDEQAADTLENLFYK